MTGLSSPCHLQRNLSRATQEQKQLSERLKEEAEQKEQLRRLKNEMENERWHLDKTIEKLQKEVRGWSCGGHEAQPLHPPPCRRA